MNCNEKAEELFEIMIKTRTSLVEIPLNYCQGETGTLLYLAFEKDEIAANQLSEILQVSLPRTVSLLNSLEAKGLIMKKIDTKDKRKTNIYITETGKNFIQNKKEDAINKMTQIINKLEEEEINQYIKLAKKIGKIIIETNNKEETKNVKIKKHN